MNRLSKKIFFILILITFFSTEVNAESLIVGIPNADTTPKGEIQFAHESQLTTKKKWNGFSFVNVGIGKKTELGISLVNLNSKKLTT